MAQVEGSDGGAAGSFRESVSPDSAIVVRRPGDAPALPILVSVPHFGTLPPDDERLEEYREPGFAHFARGFAAQMGCDQSGQLGRDGKTLGRLSPVRESIAGIEQRADALQHVHRVGIFW